MPCANCKFWDKAHQKGGVADCLRLRKWRVKTNNKPGIHGTFATRYVRIRVHASNTCPDYNPHAAVEALRMAMHGAI